MIITIIHIIIALAGSKHLPAFLICFVISNKQLEKVSIWPKNKTRKKSGNSQTIFQIEIFPFTEELLLTIILFLSNFLSFNF